MMRVMAISDLHGYLPEIPECELLLLAGDYCANKNLDAEKRFLKGDFSDWLRNVPAKYKVGIAGNHDLIMQIDPDFAKGLPWIYLRDSGVTLEGVKIWGTPWTVRYGDWAFMEPEERLGHWFEKIPTGLDILLTHGPAYQVLDKNIAGKHCGSKELRGYVDMRIPDSVVHGHIHEARGIQQLGIIRYFNVAYVNEHFAPNYGPVDIPLRGN